MLINRLKHLFYSRTLENVVNALTLSRLDYSNCAPVWSNTFRSRLQKVHNFAVRIMTGTRKFDHITLVQSLNVRS